MRGAIPFLSTGIQIGNKTGNVKLSANASPIVHPFVNLLEFLPELGIGIHNIVFTFLI